jgi:transglutaminase-like putative cysteine protease
VSSAGPVARRERLSATEKLGLSAEIVVAYAKARRGLARRSLPDIVAAMRLSAAPARNRDDDFYATGLQLGAAVTRLLGALPRDPRCLQKSLVLTELLARRSIPATLVIGVRLDPFAAHAWVEHEGRPLLPPGAGHFERLLEVSTCPR